MSVIPEELKEESREPDAFNAGVNNTPSLNMSALGLSSPAINNLDAMQGVEQTAQINIMDRFDDVQLY